MRSFGYAAVEADLERLKQIAEKAGWALGCIDVEDHEDWLNGYHSGSDGLWARISAAMKAMFTQSALVALFIVL